jgi:hypothetical protein
MEEIMLFTKKAFDGSDGTYGYPASGMAVGAGQPGR